MLWNVLIFNRCLQIVVMNSNSINTPSYCLACEVLAYTQADILVGVHGAGELLLRNVSCK